MLPQGSIGGFSWFVSVQGKTRLEANGHSPLQEAERSHEADKPTLRAFLWCPAAALQYLTKDIAIARTLRLAAKHHRNAAPINTSLTEH
ncbi:MAG: hypothetical protein U9N50_00190 [Pseudomonadota bacterium]|nr:hypothetical protein [Pseudomonadota bacterium]